VRDGKKALELAKKACELSQWNNAECLETLAAAHAELGNFKEAVKCQKQAIELGFDDEDRLKKARQQLKLYEDSKPCRENVH
jgi:tetratricopeptide (TPR) repeat protein